MMMSSRPVSSCAAAIAGVPRQRGEPQHQRAEHDRDRGDHHQRHQRHAEEPAGHPLATRARSPASMWRTSAGTSSEENSDPARNP